MKPPIQLQATLKGFSSRSDGSASIRFVTQEISGEDFSKLQEYLNDFGWVLFSANEITESDIPTADAEDTNKTPSKRIRSVLFIYWKQRGGKGNFEDFYSRSMEKFIDQIKSKLD